MTNFLCQFCCKSYEKSRSIKIHEYSCIKNPNKKPGRGGFKLGYKMSEEVKAKVSWSGKKHLPETKKKISESRIKYLTENPEQVPYLLNHYSKGRSFPEQYWFDILTQANIQFEEQKQIGRFRIDFTVGNVALEIDGEQHYVDQRIVNSNLRRDKELKALGWDTIRVRWATYKTLSPEQRELFRIQLIENLMSNS